MSGVALLRATTEYFGRMMLISSVVLGRFGVALGSPGQVCPPDSDSRALGNNCLNDVVRRVQKASVVGRAGQDHPVSFEPVSSVGGRRTMSPKTSS